MKLLTRNQLTGAVVSVTSGEAMAVVKVRLQGGQTITRLSPPRPLGMSGSRRDPRLWC